MKTKTFIKFAVEYQLKFHENQSIY